jgi:hypothetical protein
VEKLIPEWKKALHELVKVAGANLPEDKMHKRIVKGLIKQGVDKQRAESLADWAIKQHQEMQLTPEEQKRFDEICEFVNQSLDEGKSKEEITDDLVTWGLDREEALIHVNESIDYREFQKGTKFDWLEAKPESLARKSARRIEHGILWLVGGLGVIVMTYTLASSDSTGATYVIGFVAVLIGLLNLTQGLTGRVRDGISPAKGHEKEQKDSPAPPAETI